MVQYIKLIKGSPANKSHALKQENFEGVKKKGTKTKPAKVGFLQIM